jgi:hypothetical protein
MSRRPPARGFIGRNARAASISTSVLGIRRNLPMLSEFIKDLTMKKLCFGSLVGLTLNFGEGESPLPCRNGQAFLQES